MAAGLITRIFNKPIHELTEQNLINYFKTQQRETDVIEFKSYIDEQKPGTTKTERDKEKLNDIIRTICGFLNSDGGMLIWGAPKGKKQKDSKELVYFGELTHVDFQIEPDQFINKVASQISPIPLRILFQPIVLSNQKYLYVFEVAKSEFAPHQHKGTYFMRMDGSTRPAPHHYVEALMKKISYPRIKAEIHLGEMKTFWETIGIPLIVSIKNQTKFINDKNVQFILHSFGGEVIDLEGLKATEFEDYSRESRIERKAKEILHYSMPYQEQFLLITKRVMPRAYNVTVRISLTVWAELSPAITSITELKVYGDTQSGYQTKYHINSRIESAYLMDLPTDENNNSTQNNSEIKGLLDVFQHELHNYPLIKKLDR
jgi:hypothetical protein